MVESCRSAAFFLAWLVLWQTGSGAGEFNQKLRIGDPAPVWSNLPGTDGKAHSLADLEDRPIVIVVFTCNSCPVATAYEDRIIALAQQHAGNVTVVAINSNRIPEDNLEAMTQRAKAKQFPYVYLADESQQVARDYGATFTPEFFVLDGDRRIAYMGGMDDNSDPLQVTRRDLEPALAAILKGQTPAVTETLARGCRIRYARSRPAKPASEMKRGE